MVPIMLTCNKYHTSVKNPSVAHGVRYSIFDFKINNQAKIGLCEGRGTRSYKVELTGVKS